MSGLYVPLVMIPRFTTYVGAGASPYVSVPLDVSEYESANLTVWRGPLIGEAGATLALKFQDSDDADVWSNASTPITTADASSVVVLTLRRRWLRASLELAADVSDPQHAVALTCWAIGNLVRRERE